MNQQEGVQYQLCCLHHLYRLKEAGWKATAGLDRRDDADI